MKSIVLWLAAALCCGVVQAQVPHQINYQGYLTDPGGTPVSATLAMEFRLYNVATSGAALFTEAQSVTVNNGVFNVMIGAQPGQPLGLPFDVPYWLEVKVGVDAEMTPRQPLAAAPYAIRAASAEALAAGATVPGSQITNGSVALAKLANCSAEGDVAVMHNGAWVCKSSLPRYVDNGNGTVTDNQTGLMWEKKLPATDAACTNATQANRNVRCVQNTYTWSAASPYTEPTGTLFSDFAAKLNGLNESTYLGGAPCIAGHCDWRIPTVGELQTILASCPGGGLPCINAIFGPTQASVYWSSSSLASGPLSAWFVLFSDGFVGGGSKFNVAHARAVRSGR